MLYIRLLQKLHFQEDHLVVWWVFESSHMGFPADSCRDLQFRSGLISTISSSNWFTVHSEVVQIASPLKFIQNGRFHRANEYRFGFLTVSEMWTSGLKLVPLEKRILEHRKQIPSSKPTWRGNGKFYLHFRASFLFIKIVIKWELDTLNSRDVKIFRSIKSRWWQRSTMLFPMSRATVRKQFARQGERAGQIFLCDTWPCYQITFSAMGDPISEWEPMKI